MQTTPPRLRSAAPLLVGSIASLLLAAATVRLWVIPARVTLEVAFPDGAPPQQNACFYFDQGNDLSEADKACFRYDTRTREARTYTLALGNSRPLRLLRFDPLEGAGRLEVRGLWISNGPFRIRVDPGAASGFHEARSSVEGDRWILDLVGPDPRVHVFEGVTPTHRQVDGVFGLTALAGLLLGSALPGLWRRAGPHRLATGLAALAAVLAAREPILRAAVPTTVTFEIAIVERWLPHRDLQGCFYFDVGDGFSQRDRVCFPYDRRPVGDFQRYEVALHTRSAIRQLRFDPADLPGALVLRNVRVDSGAGPRPVDFARDFGHTLYDLKGTRLEIEGDALRVRTLERSSRFMLADDLGPRRLAAEAWATALAFAAVSIGGLLLGVVVRAGRGLPGRIARTRATAAFARSAVAALLVTVLGTKVFAAATSLGRFGRSLSVEDWLRLPAGDFLLVAVAGALVGLLAFVRRRAAGWRGAPVVAPLFVFCEAATGVILWSLAVFYLLSAYVFWEWGSFLEGDVLRTIYHSPAPASVRFYLARPAAGVVLVALLVAVAGGRWLATRTPPPVARAASAVVVLWALAALGPIFSPYRFDPAVVSPVLFAWHVQPMSSMGSVPSDAPRRSPPAPPRRPVPDAFASYRAVARDRDVVVVVLESVRKGNVELYGYPRPTMPNLTRMAGRGLVFDNAYALQPRSSKTLDAMLLGVDPDPRLLAFTWTPGRVDGARHLPAILRERGYRFYLGVNPDLEYDNFHGFVRALAGDALDRAIAPSDVPAAPGHQDLSEDEIMIEDFLSWYGEQEGRAFGLLWLVGAHHPYLASHRPFPEESDLDRYDNCLHSSDVALGRLEKGLERLGRRPLLLILGDHGEAFGEHFGDVLHGKYLYEESLRVPFVIVLDSTELAPRRVDARFSMKDVPATLFYLLGIDEPLGQSEVAFARTAGDRIYLSNVFGDFKLGMIDGDYKFVLRPSRNLRYLFDLRNDPGEHRNLVDDAPPETVARMEAELVGWYFEQIEYLDRRFPWPGEEPGEEAAERTAAR